MKLGLANLRRPVLDLIILLPVAGLVALLAWGLAHSGGRAGGLVNARLGEVPVEPGPARNLTLPLFDGRELKLSDLQGKVAMVDFWASWCPPCREEAPVLARVYRQFQERGVEFVGVAIWDSEEEAKRYVGRYGITYPNGLDAQGLVAIDYGVTGIPEKYFIDKDGSLVKKFIGPMNEEKLRSVLEELLAK